MTDLGTRLTRELAVPGIREHGQRPVHDNHETEDENAECAPHDMTSVRFSPFLSIPFSRGSRTLAEELMPALVDGIAH